MRAPFWVVGLSGLLGGVVGGIAAGALLLPREKMASLLPEPAPGGPGVQPPALEMGDGAEGESETLERLRRLEHRLALVTSALQEKRAQLRDEDEEGGPTPVGASNSATDVADPVFEAAVLDIFDRERERKEEERATWRKELHVERGKRYASDLGEALELSEEQKEQLAGVVAEYFDQWRALRDEESPDRPATRSEWRAVGERMSASLNEKLGSILSPEQQERYDALEPDEKLGWFGRGRRGEGRTEARDRQAAQR